MTNPLDYMSQRELDQVSLGMARPEIEFDPFIVTEEDNKARSYRQKVVSGY